MSGNASNHIWVVDSTKATGGYWVRARGSASGDIYVGAPPLTSYTTANRYLIPVANLSTHRTTVYDSDLDAEMVYIGDGTTNVAADWRYEQQYSRGAARVHSTAAILCPSSYTATLITVNDTVGTGQTEALDAAANYVRLIVVSETSTGATDMWVGFGATEAAAIANVEAGSLGMYLGLAAADSSWTVGIPALATHLALASTGADGSNYFVVSVQQGN